MALRFFASLSLRRGWSMRRSCKHGEREAFPPARREGYVRFEFCALQIGARAAGRSSSAAKIRTHIVARLQTWHWTPKRNAEEEGDGLQFRESRA